MRMTYELLWIENDLEWYETTKTLLSDELEELGFELRVTQLADDENLASELSKDGFSQFDLILIDYNLDKNQKGNEIIDKIRGHQIFTDVLFYSQKVEDVYACFSSLSLEGVYSSSRDEFEDKFNKIMRQTIKKVQEVNTMRGLIMAETSDMDVLMATNIDLFIEYNDKKSELLKKIIKKVYSSVDGNYKQITKIKEENDIQLLLKKPYFTAFHKANAHKKILSLLDSMNLNDIEEFYENYKKEVLDVRNHFAHVKEINDNGERKLESTLTGESEVFTDKRCVEIRNNLRKQHDYLVRINTEIKNQTK